MANPLSFETIKEAQNRIATYIRPTPFFYFDYLSRELKKEVFLKAENTQVTGSFKIRGAANCVIKNLAQAKKAGVIAASAGNHAQGVAAICHFLGIPSTIVMPTWAPPIKVQNTERWGAKALLHGNVYDEAYDFAKSISDKEGQLFVHPYRDADVMAGQGTLALELADELLFADCEAILVPIGGGGLISGISTVIKKLFPKIKIYGITAKNAPATYQSFKNKKVMSHDVSFTLADGVATKSTDETMLNHLTKSADDIFSISEESIANAISLLSEHAKLTVEGSGALPIAALLEGLIPEKKVCAVLSGGNIDLPTLAHVLERGLSLQDRLINLKVKITDRPGGLNALTSILATTGGNIQQIFHQRASHQMAMGEALVEIELETRGKTHTEEIIRAIQSKGFEVRRAF